MMNNMCSAAACLTGASSHASRCSWGNGSETARLGIPVKRQLEYGSRYFDA